MRPGLQRFASIVAFSAAAVGVAGCDHETASSGTAALAVRYTQTPPGVGRYEEAVFDILELSFLPVDPELAAVLGSPLGMSFGTFSTDLTATAPVSYAAIALAPGTYRFTTIRFRSPALTDRNKPTPPATCIENFALVPSGPAAGQVPQIYQFDTSDDITFTIQPGQTKLDIAVDVPGLISSFEGSFTCLDSCGGGPPCLSEFNADGFRAQFIAHVSFQ